jgi:hypothetical protein
MGTRVTGYLGMEANTDFRLVDSLTILLLFEPLGEFDRDIIRKRPQAGLTAARARVRKGGWPKALTGRKAAIAQELHNHTTIRITL